MKRKTGMHSQMMKNDWQIMKEERCMMNDKWQMMTGVYKVYCTITMITIQYFEWLVNAFICLKHSFVNPYYVEFRYKWSNYCRLHISVAMLHGLNVCEYVWHNMLQPIGTAICGCAMPQTNPCKQKWSKFSWYIKRKLFCWKHLVWTGLYWVRLRGV